MNAGCKVSNTNAKLARENIAALISKPYNHEKLREVLQRVGEDMQIN